MRKQVPPEKTKDVLDFATKKPKDRLDSIRNGLAVSLRITALSHL
jgi:eukaryotic translation initiation factor 2C